MTLQQAVFAGKVDPGNVVIHREINSPALPLAADCDVAAPVNCDTAVFLGPRSSYTITVADGKVTVNQDGPLGPGQKVSDGIDTLRNVEQLKFTDVTVRLGVPSAPTAVSATAGDTSATVSWTRAASDGGSAITSQEIVVSSGGSVVKTVTGIAPAATSSVVTGLTNGTEYTFQVRAVNGLGAGPLSAPSNAVTPRGVPAAPTAVQATTGNALVHLSWTAGSANGSPITGYRIDVRTGTTVVRTDVRTTPATTTDITGLQNGTTYNFVVRAVNVAGVGDPSAPSNTVVPGVPGPPVIGTAVTGAAGAPITVTANWAAPADTGAAVITSWRISALRMDADGVTPVGAPVVATVNGAAARSGSVPGLVNGANYRVEVVAVNRFGASLPSARSNLVAAR
jgi:predicted phage tail protein